MWLAVSPGVLETSIGGHHSPASDPTDYMNLPELSDSIMCCPAAVSARCRSGFFRNRSKHNFTRATQMRPPTFCLCDAVFHAQWTEKHGSVTLHICLSFIRTNLVALPAGDRVEIFIISITFPLLGRLCLAPRIRIARGAVTGVSLRVGQHTHKHDTTFTSLPQASTQRGVE